MRRVTWRCERVGLSQGFVRAARLGQIILDVDGHPGGHLLSSAWLAGGSSHWARLSLSACKHS